MSSRREDIEAVARVRLQTQGMPYSETELRQFTKMQRRILHSIHILKMDKEQLCMVMEVTPSTLRGHLANIAQKASKIRTERANMQTGENVERQKHMALPPLSIDDEEPTMPPPNFKRRRQVGDMPPRVRPNLQQFEEQATAQKTPPPTFTHDRFFPSDPAPIQRATASLPMTFHPSKPMFVESINPVMPENKQSNFGSFKRN